MPSSGLSSGPGNSVYMRAVYSMTSLFLPDRGALLTSIHPHRGFLSIIASAPAKLNANKPPTSLAG